MDDNMEVKEDSEIKSVSQRSAGLHEQVNDTIRLDKRLSSAGSDIVSLYGRKELIDDEYYQKVCLHSKEILKSSKHLKKVYRNNPEAREDIKNLFKWVYTHVREGEDVITKTPSGHEEHIVGKDMKEQAAEEMYHLGETPRCSCVPWR